MCTCTFHSHYRLRKLIVDYESQMRSKDLTVQQLTRELETRMKDADVQAKTLRELKEILQTHVNPSGPAQFRHRTGEAFLSPSHTAKPSYACILTYQYMYMYMYL